MRSTSLVLTALTGLAVSTFAAPAGAFTPLSSAGVGSAAQSVDPVASVHCRSYKHRSYNHGWGYGCRGGGGVHFSIHEREGDRVHRHGFEEREGGRARVGVHERSSTRSETDVRSRESTTTRRSHEGSSPRGEVKGGTSTRSSTTGKPSTTGNQSETGGTSGGGTSGGGGKTEQKSGTQH
jgi:hypothetical protein